MLYKYYPLTPYNLDALKVGYFYFSKAKCLNDPFDMTFELVSKNIISKLFSNEPTIASASRKMGAPDKPCGVGRADANPKLLLNDT